MHCRDSVVIKVKGPKDTIRSAQYWAVHTSTQLWSVCGTIESLVSNYYLNNLNNPGSTLLDRTTQVKIWDRRQSKWSGSCTVLGFYYCRVFPSSRWSAHSQPQNNYYIPMTIVKCNLCLGTQSWFILNHPLLNTNHHEPLITRRRPSQYRIHSSWRKPFIPSWYPKPLRRYEDDENKKCGSEILGYWDDRMA